MQDSSVFEIIEYIAALILSEKRKICTELRLQLIHFEVLNYLSHSNRYTDTPAATAYHFGMTRGTVSQSLIILEKKGYLEKSKDEADKRIIHIKLLPPGKSILKKAHRAELFSAATLLLKNDCSVPINFTSIFNLLFALQKASQSQSFKSTKIHKNSMMKNPSVFDLIEYMAVLIRSEERRRCSELKLQLVHFQVLEYLSSCNKYSDTPASIANYLGMTRGTVSQSLIILEKRAFIEKTQDQTDKRVFHIQLLNDGLSILNKAKPTQLFTKAAKILEKNLNQKDAEKILIKSLTALQKANNSYSFGICNSCINFTKKPANFFCELTQEKLSRKDSQKICQEHQPV